VRVVEVGASQPPHAPGYFGSEKKGITMKIIPSSTRQPGVVNILDLDESDIINLVEALDQASRYFERKARKLRKNKKAVRNEVEYSEEMAFFLYQAGVYQRMRMDLMYGYDETGSMGWRS
jgi:hypothetical protein